MGGRRGIVPPELLLFNVRCSCCDIDSCDVSSLLRWTAWGLVALMMLLAADDDVELRMDNTEIVVDSIREDDRFVIFFWSVVELIILLLLLSLFLYSA